MSNGELPRPSADAGLTVEEVLDMYGVDLNVTDLETTLQEHGRIAEVLFKDLELNRFPELMTEMTISGEVVVTTVAGVPIPTDQLPPENLGRLLTKQLDRGLVLKDLMRTLASGTPRERDQLREDIETRVTERRGPASGTGPPDGRG